MDKTTRLQLSLPGVEDYADIAELNENFRVLDGAALLDPGTGKIPAEQVPVTPVDEQLAAAAVKAAPADADGLALADSADGNKLKRLLWGRMLELLGGRFAAKSADGTYAPAAHASSHGKTGADPVTPGAIGAAVAPAPVAVTFSVAGWVKNAATGCYEQTVACPGLLSSDDKRTAVSPVGSTDAAAQKLTDAAEALVDRYACTTNGKLYARCPEKAPAVAFQVAVTIVRG